jgi:hypothetical protein
MQAYFRQDFVEFCYININNIRCVYLKYVC